jgi:hypothetical protein
MGRIIVATGLGGIALITALSWHLANGRIGTTCGSFVPDRDCVGRLTAQRDFILTAGLAVALAFVIASLCVFAILKARQARLPIEPTKSWAPTSSGQPARLR